MAADKNSPDQAFERALSLLGGGASASDAHTAIALIDQAEAQGHADATAMAAVLHAMGAMRPQSWAAAIDTLSLAAERGSASAQSQLQVIAGVEQAKADSGDWEEIRSAVQIQALLRSPASASISDTPLVREIKAFASPAECRWVIDRASPRLAPAAVWGDRGARVDQHRSNSALPITVADTDLVVELLRGRISHALQIPVALFEPPQILHYSVGQEFVPHYDFLDPQHPSQAAAMAQWGQRIGTFLIYLNGEFEGGETEFPRAGLNYRGSAGDALFFSNVTRDGRPDPLTLHAGRPPTSGEKWVMSTWIRDGAPVR